MLNLLLQNAAVSRKIPEFIYYLDFKMTILCTISYYFDIHFKVIHNLFVYQFIENQLLLKML